MSAELQSPRSKIDEIDRQLVQLMAERMAVVRAIANAKKADTDAPLRDHHREQEVMANWLALGRQNELSDYFVGRILRELMNYSRRVQEEILDRGQDETRLDLLQVGYLGSQGSYSDLTLT